MFTWERQIAWRWWRLKEPSETKVRSGEERRRECHVRSGSTGWHHRTHHETFLSLLYTGQTWTGTPHCEVAAESQPGGGRLSARLPGEKSATSSRECCRPGRGNSHQPSTSRQCWHREGANWSTSTTSSSTDWWCPAHKTTQTHNCSTSQTEFAQSGRRIFPGLRCTPASSYSYSWTKLSGGENIKQNSFFMTLLSCFLFDILKGYWPGQWHHLKYFIRISSSNVQ